MNRGRFTALSLFGERYSRDDGRAIACGAVGAEGFKCAHHCQASWHTSNTPPCHCLGHYMTQHWPPIVFCPVVNRLGELSLLACTHEYVQRAASFRRTQGTRELNSDGHAALNGCDWQTEYQVSITVFHSRNALESLGAITYARLHLHLAISLAAKSSFTCVTNPNLCS